MLNIIAIVIFCLFFIYLFIYLSLSDPLIVRSHPKPPPKRRSLWPYKNIVAHYIGKGDIFSNMTAGY